MSLLNRAAGKRAATPAQRPNTFFGGAAILAVGIVVVKFIGFLYKIPLYNIIGQQGSADFNNAYNIYSVLLIISTAGLPVAVSKLVSEANALGRRNQVRKIFRLSLLVFLLLGCLSFLAMFFAPNQLAGLMNDTLAAPGIKALAPAVICVGCLSAFRGYFQGHQNMTPTAVSQILEAVVKLALGLALAGAVMGMTFSVSDLPRFRPDLDLSTLTAQGLADAVTATQTSLAAAGAIVGVTVGTILALGYMMARFLIARAREPLAGKDTPDSGRAILSTLLKIAVPITLSASMVGIVTVIDAALVQGQLQKLYLLQNGITQITQQAENLMLDYSRTLYGNYSGALNLYNYPLSMMAAITASVIPAVSAHRARKNQRGASRIVSSSLRVTALLAFPMGMGLMALGQPIMALVFPALDAEVAGPLLSTLGLASIFVCLMLVCNSVLQAYGFVNLPILIMLLGGIVKIVTNYNLVAVAGVRGAPVGNVLCFGLCLVLDLVVIARVIPDHPRYLPIFLKPAVCSGIMGLGAWALYGLGSKMLTGAGVLTQEVEGAVALSRTGNAVCTLLSIVFAVLVYGILVIATKTISKEDLSLMPKGEKLAKLLRLS